MPPSENGLGGAGSPGSPKAAPAATAEIVAGPIGDERLQRLYAYWRHKAADRSLPSRADLDPVEIPKLLPHIMLIDVLPSGGYHYRLIGTENEIGRASCRERV